MDIQPLVVLITGEGQLHGFSHTLVGATLLAMFSGLSGKYLAEIGLYILGINRQWQIKISWWVAALSSFIGTFSHVLLDSIMHGDVEPFYPFTKSNDFLGLISVAALHKVCLYSALVGGVLFFSINWIQKSKKSGRFNAADSTPS